MSSLPDHSSLNAETVTAQSHRLLEGEPLMPEVKHRRVRPEKVQYRRVNPTVWAMVQVICAKDTDPRVVVRSVSRVEVILKTYRLEP